MAMRRFLMQRSEDVSGCSGIGTVAEGVVFETGKVALSWYPGKAGICSVALYDSAEDVVALHGHQGRTTLLYLDHARAPITPLEQETD